MSSFLKYVLCLMLSLMMTAGYIYARDLFRRYEEYQENEALVQKLDQEREMLRSEVYELRTRVEQLNSDPVEIEASIRRTKNMVRRNERIYRVELPEDNNTGISEKGVDGTTDTGDSTS